MHNNSLQVQHLGARLSYFPTIQISGSYHLPVTLCFSFSWDSSCYETQNVIIITKKTLHWSFKGKAIPVQAWTGTEGTRSLRLPTSWQSAHEGGKFVSPIHWPPLRPPVNIPGTHFCQRLSQPQGHSATRRIMSMKNSNDTTRNRTCDLPACIAVP